MEQNGIISTHKITCILQYAKKMNLFRRQIFVGSIILISIICNKCYKPDIIPFIRYELLIEIKDPAGKNILNNIDKDQIQESFKISGQNNSPLKGCYFYISEIENLKLLKIRCFTDHNIKLGEINYVLDGQKLLGTAKSNNIKSIWRYEKNNMHLKDLYFNDKQIEHIKVSEFLTYYSIKIPE